MSATATPATPSITIDDLLDEIVQDTVRLKYYRDNFRYLYATDRSNIDILNAVAPGFFGAMQQMMFDDAILRVAKLVDSAGNKHQQNVSLARLLVTTEWETNDPTKWQKYQADLKAVEAACHPCVMHRHKRISHKDLAAHQKRLVLPAPTLKMVDDAATAVEKFVGAVWTELQPDSSYSFDEILNGQRDVEQLMRHLRNRASQKKPDAVSSVVSEPAATFFDCAFCGEKKPIAVSRTDATAFRRSVRRHYDDCHGVIGCETITIDSDDLLNTGDPIRFKLDLRVPTHQTP